MKGLIFDMDGTILDSMPYWQRQLDDMLIARGITPPSDLLDRTKTLGLENATGMILEEFHLPDDPAVVYHQFQVNMEELYCGTIQLKPGVLEYMNAMRDNATMCVATATAHDMVEKVLTYDNIRHYFQSVTTCKEVGIGKHDPKIYLVAAEKMGLAPKDCVVLEDSLEGLMSAKRAGFRTVGVYEASNPKEQEALMREADVYIHDFRELLS